MLIIVHFYSYKTCLEPKFKLHSMINKIENQYKNQLQKSDCLKENQWKNITQKKMQRGKKQERWQKTGVMWSHQTDNALVFNTVFLTIAQLRVHARWTGSSISAWEPQSVPWPTHQKRRQCKKDVQGLHPVPVQQCNSTNKHDRSW